METQYGDNVSIAWNELKTMIYSKFIYLFNVFRLTNCKKKLKK